MNRPTDSSDLSPWTLSFAAEHGVELRVDSPLPGNLPAYKFHEGALPIVVLDNSLPAERLNFALAHEVAHILLGHTDEVQPNEEAEANSLASEMLLPDQPFRSDASLPLEELKTIYSHASYEALARRKLRFSSAVLTIVDNGAVTRRLLSDGFNAPPRPTDEEWQLIRDAISTKTSIEIFAYDLTMRATYVDDGRGVARVLLIVEAD